MVVTSARSVALYGGIFLLPLFLQDLMGRTEIDTGLLLLPGALVMGLVMLVSGRIADRFGTRASTMWVSRSSPGSCGHTADSTRPRVRGPCFTRP